jgi:hypothetical protein
MFLNKRVLNIHKKVGFNEIAYQFKLPRHSDYCIFYEITENDWKILLDINDNLSYDFLASEYKRITDQLLLFMSYNTSTTIIDQEMMKNIIKSNGIDNNLYANHFTNFNCLEYNISILMLLKTLLLQISNSITPKVCLFSGPTKIINDFFSELISKLKSYINFHEKISSSSFEYFGMKYERYKNIIPIDFRPEMTASPLEYYEMQYEKYKNIVTVNNLNIFAIYAEFDYLQHNIIENNIIFNAEYCAVIIELLKFIVSKH